MFEKESYTIPQGHLVAKLQEHVATFLVFLFNILDQ